MARSRPLRRLRRHLPAAASVGCARRPAIPPLRRRPDAPFVRPVDRGGHAAVLEQPSTGLVDHVGDQENLSHRPGRLLGRCFRGPAGLCCCDVPADLRDPAPRSSDGRGIDCRLSWVLASAVGIVGARQLGRSAFGRDAGARAPVGVAAVPSAVWAVVLLRSSRPVHRGLALRFRLPMLTVWPPLSSACPPKLSSPSLWRSARRLVGRRGSALLLEGRHASLDGASAPTRDRDARAVCGTPSAGSLEDDDRRPGPTAGSSSAGRASIAHRASTRSSTTPPSSVLDASSQARWATRSRGAQISSPSPAGPWVLPSCAQDCGFARPPVGVRRELSGSSTRRTRRLRTMRPRPTCRDRHREIVPPGTGGAWHWHRS